jgi:hypothetical protein
MRVKVLFWNYNIEKGSSMAREANKAAPLARMVKGQGVDVLIVADCKLSTDQILASLSALGLEFSPTKRPHDRVRFFKRSAGFDLIPVLSDDRMDFYRLISGGFEEILVGATHLHGRRDVPLPESRLAKLAPRLLTLAEAERRVGHDRTLLAGDFNMTPDEMGMIGPENAFGALMTWDLAEIRSKSGRRTPRFFNPMWSLMGRSEAPGTYYWRSTDPYNIFWHCLDGVLARPSLRGVFLEESLKIVTSIVADDGREIPLFRQARRHWKFEYSDHLPIFFELKLREATRANHD